MFGILVISLFGFIKGKESNGQLGFMFEMFIKNSGKAQFVAAFMTFQTQVRLKVFKEFPVPINLIDFDDGYIPL